MTRIRREDSSASNIQLRRIVLQQACLFYLAGDQVNAPDRNALDSLLGEHNDVFEGPKKLPPMRSCNHHIPRVPNAKPFKLAPYRYPHNQKNEIGKQIKEMLQNGIIRTSHSLFASLVLVVKRMILGDSV